MGVYNNSLKDKYQVKELDDLVTAGIILGDGFYDRCDQSSTGICLYLKKYDKEYLNYPNIKKNIGGVIEEYQRDYGVVHEIVNVDVPRSFVVKRRFRYIPSGWLYKNLRNKNKIRSFLRGLYSANGSYTYGTLVLYQTSYHLIKQVQNLLKRIGIKSSVVKVKARFTSIQGRTVLFNEKYELRVHRKEDIKRFSSEISFLQEPKIKKLC